MASFGKLPSGQWRVQVRREGHALTRTFRLKSEADAWAREQEGRIDKGETPMGRMPASRETLADLIELHFADLAEVGRVFGRSKEATLLRLKDTIGHTNVHHVTRDMLVQFAKRRAKEGAGPVTIGIDISFIGTVLEHAAAVHGVTVPIDQLRLARIALHRLGLISKSAERDRRPTEDELERIITTADNNPRQIIPLSRIIRSAFPRSSSRRHKSALRSRLGHSSSLSRFRTPRLEDASALHASSSGIYPQPRRRGQSPDRKGTAQYSKLPIGRRLTRALSWRRQRSIWLHHLLRECATTLICNCRGSFEPAVGEWRCALPHFVDRHARPIAVELGSSST